MRSLLLAGPSSGGGRGRVIVYVDDAAHAQQILAPLLACEPAAGTHWVLVAAPRA